ncbi:hypothetical protein CRU99_04845 [Malaciobacter mytili]|uniref:Uncharacterized protein n=1 Tax=Malaciobacter mytili LMG 24559 TaxID=1032238 RepID=A0AAX2AEK8_9BACT|nr:hypothetical protein [Malaciobacter mytili]AXH13639.1 hypothetical protein AMYT_0011 [Malaciobacter mytili LMG 24559]RXI44676.1 hypothetical protein CRU99_04845 [Malaciobacter mytili]RXK13823.1 hypothetical protein CP985_12815 [Malaciobacter mytili LMG 24559]
MSITFDVVEKLNKAFNSTCINELKMLANSESMIVRRAVAKNVNIDTALANELSFDPVLNVSYMALNNPKSTVKREIPPSNLTKCVVCQKDERYMDCTLC